MKKSYLFGEFKNKKGIMAVLIALFMIVLLGFAALAFDIGYFMLTKNELQNVADAAALAAARKLGELLAANPGYDCDADGYASIVAVAKDIAFKNTAGNLNIDLNTADIEVGTWSEKSFNPGFEEPDAIRIVARRDNLANGAVKTFFGKILGIDDVEVSARAVAALTGMSTAAEGVLQIPVGISRFRFESEYCQQDITFSPTKNSCAAWNTFTSSPACASGLRTILDGLREGTYVCPEVIAGQTKFYVSGGMIDNAFNNFMDLFNKFKGSDGKWEVTVAVYDMDDCSNPNKDLTIVGFATAKIYFIDEKEHIIKAEILCDKVEDGRGGGNDYGTKGIIPNLVQ